MWIWTFVVTERWMCKWHSRRVLAMALSIPASNLSNQSSSAGNLFDMCYHIVCLFGHYWRMIISSPLHVIDELCGWLFLTFQFIPSITMYMNVKYNVVYICSKLNYDYVPLACWWWYCGHLHIWLLVRCALQWIYTGSCPTLGLVSTRMTDWLSLDRSTISVDNQPEPPRSIQPSIPLG